MMLLNDISTMDTDQESMIKIRDAYVYDLFESVKASKFPMAVHASYADTVITATQLRLANATPGSGHDNYLQGIHVAFTMDITVKALVEAERYHFLEIVSSTSTMHRITSFDLNECYCKYVDPRMISVMNELVCEYNEMAPDDPRRDEQYLKILYSNPCGFTYTIRFTTNYRQLKTIYNQRRNHRLPEWREFCRWIEGLPYSEFITGKKGEAK